jgi:hypothetical protein
MKEKHYDTANTIHRDLNIDTIDMLTKHCIILLSIGKKDKLYWAYTFHVLH